MKKNIFLFVLIFSFTYTVASEVQQFFYGIKVAAVVTVITLGIQPTCGDVTFNNKLQQDLLGNKPKPLSLLPAALDSNQISDSCSFCLSNLCNPGPKGYVLPKETLESKDLSCLKKESVLTHLPAALPEQKTSKFCLADREGSYNPGKKGYLLQ